MPGSKRSTLIRCADCGLPVLGAPQRRRCDDCNRTRNNRRVRRWLSPGEPIPEGQPLRSVTSHGYVRLSWLVGTRSYVETYEHRIFGGVVTTEDEVHHVNRKKADNRPSNLRPLSAEDHALEHAAISWHTQAARLYASGMPTTQVGKKLGHHPASVWRALMKMGVPIRKEARVAVPRRERQRD